MSEVEFVRIEKRLMEIVAVLGKKEKRSKTNMVNVLLSEAIVMRDLAGVITEPETV